MKNHHILYICSAGLIAFIGLEILAGTFNRIERVCAKNKDVFAHRETKDHHKISIRDTLNQSPNQFAYGTFNCIILLKTVGAGQAKGSYEHYKKGWINCNDTPKKGLCSYLNAKTGKWHHITFDDPTIDREKQVNKWQDLYNFFGLATP